MYNFANPLCPETQRGFFLQNNRLQTPTNTFTLRPAGHIASANLIALK